MNVAWNLQGMGLSPVFLSAIGNDPEGHQIRESMRSWGMNTDLLQQNDRPTGHVDVTISEGQPSYEIVEDVAYDFIESPGIRIDKSQFSILCHGSLAFRSGTTRETMTKLIRESGLPRFVDINIRDPFFDEAWLDTLIGGARWLKLSEDELARLTNVPCHNKTQIGEAARSKEAVRYRQCPCDLRCEGRIRIRI